MYKKLKQAFIFLSLVIVTVISVRFISTYQNEMFGGYKEVISIEQATLGLRDELASIAKKYQATIAKQIVTTPKNEKEGLRNTYQKIGTGKLPTTLPQQTDKEIIEKSPDVVIYVIVGGSLDAQKLSSLLNEKGNITSPYKTSQQLIVLKQLVLVPQSLLAILALLFAFIALLTANYISFFKKAGVHRLAGEKVGQFIFRQTWQDTNGVLLAFLLCTISSIVFFKIKAMFSMLYLEIILITLISFALLLFSCILVVSLVFFIVMKKQPIGLLIKGKAPIHGVTILVVLLQFFSAIVAVYSVSYITVIRKQEQQLNAGRKEWAKSPQYYGLTQIQGESKPEDWQNFFREILADEHNMLVNNQFDAIVFSQRGNYGEKAKEQANGYYPTPYQDENVLMVSYSFLKKANLQIPKKLDEELSHMKTGEYGLLIPKSQEKQEQKLTDTWRAYYDQPNEEKVEGFQVRQIEGIYDSPSSEIFAYPVFGPTHFRSDAFYAKEPLIFVFSPESFETQDIGMLSQYLYQLLVTDTGKTKELIKKYHLELSIGAFINGYMAANQQLKIVQTQEIFLIGTSIFALISSILLCYFTNTIYLYQNRRKFTIERLSGMKFIQIYKKYLVIISSSVLGIEGIIFLLKMPWVAFGVPIVYAMMIVVVFALQIKREKAMQIQYLKGE